MEFSLLCLITLSILPLREKHMPQYIAYHVILYALIYPYRFNSGIYQTCLDVK